MDQNAVTVTGPLSRISGAVRSTRIAMTLLASGRSVASRAAPRGALFVAQEVAREPTEIRFRCRSTGYVGVTSGSQLHRSG
jgi:hypothetical protein